MNYRQLDEKLTMIINEHALYDTPCWGNADSIMDAYNNLLIKESGSYIAPDKVKIKKVIDDREIAYKYCKEIQKGIIGVINYPLKICYGEQDIYKHGSYKRGHGLSHSTQKHDSIKEALNSLSDVLVRNIATLDKKSSNENYVIKTNKYTYAFAIKNGYAILVTAFKNL